MKFYNILTAKHRKSVISSLFALPFLLSMSGGAMATLDPSEEDYALKLLGKYLFFDKISSPRRQACASCHTPDAGWTNGVSRVNKTQVAVNGAMRHTVGTLKPPAASYATLIPDFGITPPGGPGGNAPFGGNFWNGRATGEEVRNLGILGGDLDKYAKYFGGATDQAHASPFINPVEQGLPNITAVCRIVKKAKYAPLYKIAYGERIRCGMDHVEVTFGRIALAIGAYESSGDVNMFDSKRDRALKDDADGNFPLDDFTDQENLGHDLFYGIASDLNPGPNPKNAGCGAFCHRNGNPQGTDPQERYTGDGYFNIGTPRNVEIPNNPEPNIGVAAVTGNDAHKGDQKSPTLRNVDKRKRKKFVKAYTHNGWFKSLESLVHFYNTSTIGGTTANGFGITRCPDDVVTEKDALAQNCWPKPMFDNSGEAGVIPGAGVLRFIIGDRGLTLEEEAAVVAYLKTLSDIPTAKKPKPFNLKRFYKGKPF